MKIEPTKLTRIIEQNYSHLMPDFFEMQTEYLASLNIIYHDLDASLVAMVITSQLYKNRIKEDNSKRRTSIKYFYEKDNHTLPTSDFKIKEISTILNLPRETVRRKKEKLIKDKLIILNKENKSYSLNTDMIEQKILDLQISNLSKFLSKFSLHFSKNRLFIRKVSTEKIKQDVEEKFLLYLTKFLDFQISYFAKYKTLIDTESIFIFLLCSLNTTAKMKNRETPATSKEVFGNINIIKNTLGLNATSISEITKVPRTTVIRKIAYLEKMGLLKKDKFKRYTSDDLNKTNDSKKIMSIMDHNIKLLGVFFSECIETYSAK